MLFRVSMLLVWLVVPWSRLVATEPVPRQAAELRLLDLNGRRVNPFGRAAEKAVVFVFISNTCPIANRYAPELQRLHGKYVSQGVAFWLVHADADETPQTISSHARDYGYSCGILRDPQHDLVNLAKARVTPEAALFRTNGELLYHGRIDNQYVDFGKARREPTTRDLQNAIEAVLANRSIAVAETEAIGCYIPRPK